MKRTLILICAAALALVGCQKQLAPEQVSESASGSTIEAYALPSASSKAVYEENVSGALAGKWEVGDVIFGLNGSTPFQFEVTAVDSEGKATLTQSTEVAFAAGDVLQAAFCPGKTAADLSAGSFALDLSEQKADVVPVLLLSKATVAEGPSVSFSFTNATSVVALKAPVFPVGISEGKKITNVTLSGHEIVSSGVVSVVGDEFVFTPDAPCNFIRKNVSLAAVDVDGTSYKIDEPVYIVIPAAGKISKISALDNKNGFFTYDLSASAVGTAAPEASKYYTLSGKTFTKVNLPESTITVDGVVWSRWNFGGEEQVNAAGGLYRWADTKKIYTAVTSSTITPDSEHSAGFVDYTGEIYCTDASTQTYSKYADAGKYLEPIDDVIQLTYPGTGWRIPKLEEFQSLAALKDDTNYTVELNPESFVGIKYTDKKTGVSMTLRGNQPIVTGATATKINQGKYWVSNSTSDTTKGYAAQYFQVVVSSGAATGATKNSIAKRCLGYSVRPVKTVE